MNKTSVGFTLTLLALAACGGASAAPAIAPAPAVEAPAPGAAVSGSFAITAQNSKIDWTGSKTSAHHDGSFTSFTGKIDLPGAIERGSVSIDIDTPSLTIAADPALGPMVDKLAGHLKSPDFFDVAKFPKATFVSSSIAPSAGGGAANYTVGGTLTLHGVSKPISFPATIAASAAKVDAAATFTINRKDFGLAYPGKPDDLIKDDVQIKLTIHADKQ